MSVGCLLEQGLTCSEDLTRKRAWVAKRGSRVVLEGVYIGGEVKEDYHTSERQDGTVLACDM